MDVRNLTYLRSLSTKEMPGFGQKLYEALSDVLQAHQNLAQQVNGNSTGNPEPPPAINGVTVSGQNGHFNVAITDNNDVFRDVHYYVEHSDNPQFTNPQIVHLGHTRNMNLFLGNVTRYFRAYSAYASSASSSPAYHGGAASPQAVSGGGSVGGPAFEDSQGSGTGVAGQGLSGPGPVPFRSKTGVPPTR